MMTHEEDGSDDLALVHIGTKLCFLNRIFARVTICSKGSTLRLTHDVDPLGLYAASDQRRPDRSGGFRVWVAGGAEDPVVRDPDCGAGRTGGGHWLGKLGRCRLAAEFSRDGLRLAAGSDVVFGRGGVSAGVLAADQMVGGYWGAKGSEVALSEDGVERVTLARDQVIEGLLCLAGTEVRFGFGEGGRQRLESCTVGEVTEWKGVRWPRRTTLEWHEDSYLKATLTEDSPSVRIGEVVVFAGSEVQLVGESRRVDFVHGPKKAGGVGAEVRGMKLQWFNTAEDGSAWGELAEAEVVEGRAHAKGATVRFTLARPR